MVVYNFFYKLALGTLYEKYNTYSKPSVLIKAQTEDPVFILTFAGLNNFYRMKITICILLNIASLGLAAQQLPKTIGFGSCGHEDHPLPVFEVINKHNPDLFIFLGDNIYGDTDVMDTLKAKYNRLAAHNEFQKLRENTEILAIWDDHDFGRNDAGRHYPFKKESKEIFMDFWGESKNSERRNHEGIYDVTYRTDGNKTLQIILLDNRTFRDNLKPYGGEQKENKSYFYELDYSPHTSKDSTLLGETQWRWLENVLQQPADVRLICSGSQFSIAYNGYEAWANFPHEQQRMLDLISKTRAKGVLFLSGDVHYAELSKLENPKTYPVYDVTASGLSSTWHFATPNKNRIEGPVMDNHFGKLSFFWDESPVRIKAEVIDVKNNSRFEYEIFLDELEW